jgi:hypothetical protein
VEAEVRLEGFGQVIGAGWGEGMMPDMTAELGGEGREDVECGWWW